MTIPAQKLDGWLSGAGFTERSILGVEDSPPTIDDTRMVVVATRRLGQPLSHHRCPDQPTLGSPSAEERH